MSPARPLLALALAAAAAQLCACGAPPERRVSKQEIRDRLRAGERQSAEGLAGRPSRPPERAAPAAPADPGARVPLDACSELSCLDPALHFAAEGFGPTERDARAAASAELSARVQSEVQSVVNIRYEERGDGSAQQSGSVQRTISTSFKYGELLLSLPPRAVGGGQVAVVSYLKKADYRDRLKRDYGRGLEDLRFQLRDATRDGVSDARFVQSWRAMRALFSSFDEYVAQHKAVLGSSPEGGDEVDAKLSEANARRRAILGRSEVLITVDGAGAKELSGALTGALQSMMLAWQVRGRAGSACREGALRLNLSTDLSSTTHAVTGEELLELSWEAAVSACPSPEVISSAQMPKLRGAARYNKAAAQALVEFVESLRKEAQSGAAGGAGAAAKAAAEIQGALEGLLSDALPL